MTDYTENEERLNVLTHGLGIPAGVFATILLILKANNLIGMISAVVFGISLVLLYTASTLYHATKTIEKRKKLRVFDHSAIFVLIAGTYTPVCLITLKENIGTGLIIAIWGIAVGGIILKLFFTGRFDVLSTLLYVGMGWLAIFAINPLLKSMSPPGLMWLLIGGLCYTIGAILYSIKRIPFNHAIFHVFVLAVSFSHFMMVYRYVI
jgi:hemolysin III